MDILLTHAYYLYEDPHELAVMKPYPPLGLLYISSYLKSRGFTVGVFDATFARPADFRELLARERPPVVGVYCTLMTRGQALRMIREAKDVGAFVVVGGPEPTNYVEEYLDRGADAIVIGEGEQTLEELLPRLAGSAPRALEQVAGLAFRGDDGAIVRTAARPGVKDLDALPFPDRAAIDIPAYLRVWREHHGVGPVSLITARGCPFTCNWCSHSVFGYTHRRRSPENVVAELEQILETYGPDQVWYADDVFTIHHAWFFKYAELLKQRGLRVPFETISREDRLNERVVATLAEMGCQKLWIGAESGSQKVLEEMQRRTSAERVREMTHLLQRHGIAVGMFIMLGYEGEGLEDIQATIDHLKVANPDTVLTTVAYPIKGTKYYDRLAADGRVKALKAWEAGSDRDYAVLGRHSRRFYAFATRRLVNELAFHRQRRSGQPNYPRMAKALVNAGLGHLGMLLTQREVERGQPA